MKLSSPLYMLMDIKAHFISISCQGQKTENAEWLKSQNCKVSPSCPYHSPAWLTLNIT